MGYWIRLNFEDLSTGISMERKMLRQPGVHWESMVVTATIVGVGQGSRVEEDERRTRLLLHFWTENTHYYSTI